MGAVLLGRAHWHDECRPLEQTLPHRDRSHFFQTPGVLVLSHWGRSWVFIVVAAGGAAAEWLRQPAVAWVWVAWVCVVAEVAILWPLGGWRRRGLALLLCGLAAGVTIGQRQLKAIETR